MKKNVSKLLAIMMMLSIVVGLAACSSQESKYVGEWKCTTYSAQGSAADLVALDTELNIVLNNDGSVSSTSSELSGTGTWAETNDGISITSHNDTLTFKYVNGKLELTEPSTGVLMIFEKQAK